MAEELIEAEAEAEAEVVDYPGLEFSPPAGTVDDALEGEALVKWKKVGDRYTIVEFEGEPLQVVEAAVEDAATPEAMSKELSAMDEEGM